jgi:hypothetical protein
VTLEAEEGLEDLADRLAEASAVSCMRGVCSGKPQSQAGAYRTRPWYSRWTIRIVSTTTPTITARTMSGL